MQRHAVLKWFAVSLLGAALAAALVLDLSLVRPTKPAAAPLLATPQQAAQEAPKHMTIEPSRIEIVAKRLPPQVAAGANPVRRKQQG